ncbi:hypothetical protein RHGRI_007970 [Rhododendron griersonianum]|uniref:Uncharacterized protein n=1 Tax=Rhododendron griersonianum TaxID=479676 RepID=A0AAV6KYX5_9ERIC|nr:hypothetical protein RHGRI_007970 [Rhododendron griersonianum]
MTNAFPFFPNGGFTEKNPKRHKSIKSFIAEATDGGEGDKTGMIIFRGMPCNVEKGTRLKQKEVALDDAIVEDTPPSKIVRKSSKAIRTQKNLSKRRTRFGSIGRGIKDKHPRSRKPQDENEGEIRETTYCASLNGIKTLIEELELSDDHKEIKKATPF